VGEIHYDWNEFQSTRPQGARPIFVSYKYNISCFNPRARRGRDWGAGNFTLDNMRFNPRARRGRDLIRVNSTLFLFCFNPRARRGRDLSAAEKPEQRLVSIHAPAGGATSHLDSGIRITTSFNPRARRGRDEGGINYWCDRVMFQSTRPQGARPSYLCTHLWYD